MLIQLKIENIALIEIIEINFEKGLNIITGDSGSGKSLILDSLNALFGGTNIPLKQLIRKGKEFCVIEAIFSSSSQVNNWLIGNGFQITSSKLQIKRKTYKKNNKILSKYSEPDIAVITNIGTAHIGLLGSKKNITYAKCEISKFLNPEGVVIIPSNDPFLEKTLKGFWKGRVIKVKLLNIENQKDSFKKDDNLRGFYNPSNKTILIEENTFEISFEGFHNASNFLFAYAVAKELGLDFASFNKFDFVSLGGRNKILKSVKTTIYDESYNASPESVKACIKNLLEKPRNKFFIFGSMQELGKESEKYHKEIFNLINNSDIEKCLFICDKENEKIYSNYLKDKNKFLVLNNIKDVPQEINKSTKKGDSVLIKGSRYWQLEKIIELIN